MIILMRNDPENPVSATRESPAVVFAIDTETVSAVERPDSVRLGLGWRLDDERRNWWNSQRHNLGKPDLKGDIVEVSLQ